MEERFEGRVKWFSNERGYGFINPLNEGEVEPEEYFVHFSSIEIDGFKTLEENQDVTFELMDTERGIQAVKVKPV